jgi:hypothetical protein
MIKKKIVPTATKSANIKTAKHIIRSTELKDKKEDFLLSPVASSNAAAFFDGMVGYELIKTDGQVQSTSLSTPTIHWQWLESLDFRTVFSTTLSSLSRFCC